MGGIRWTPGIGDPTFLGWLTVFAYFFCSWLCLRAFMAEKAGPVRPYGESVRALWRVFRKHWPHVPTPARRAALWLGFSVAMALLGVNKQLDLQSLFTDVGRLVAHEQGWYDQRRVVQGAFILVLLGFGALTIVALGYLTRGKLRDFRLSLSGLAFLLTFVVIRAASFHNMDRLIGTTFLGVRFNGIFELSGIGLIALGAWRRLRAVTRDRGSPQSHSKA